MKTQGILLAALAVGALTACGNARTPEQYGADARAMLDSKTPEIKSCYDAEIAHGARGTGSVIVHFTIAPALGTINAMAIDPRSNAPEPLGKCVMDNIKGLTLAPADSAAGIATYTWEFTIGPPPPAIAIAPKS
ncbi:MAG TPA: hypothetical protein VGM56_19245 [Byssovorax sp.]|jgi:hypothetical protein